MLRRPNTLKQRLILIMLTTTGLALLLADALMFAAEVSSLKKAMVKDVSIKADLIGSQCSAALLFNSYQDAEETLQALHADGHVEYAAVYTREGKLFAAYRSWGSQAQPPSAPPSKDDHQFTHAHLDLTHPILLYGERIGTVVIRSDLKALTALLARYVAAAVIVLLVALLVAYALLVRLQRTVTGPVSGLVQIIDRISRDQDFTIRAAFRGPAELRALGDGFNGMLSALEMRDKDLAKHRAELEDLVASLRRSTGEVQEAYRKLEKLDKLKSDFITIVSHEFRTPLTSIKAFVELILMKPYMDAERKIKLLRTINSESDRLGRLINDLLDLSRIETGGMTWKDTEAPLEDVIQASVAGITPLATSRKQNLIVRPAPAATRIFADRDRVVQVITNILSNAVKFTPEGGTITIEARREPGSQPFVTVAVSDTGPGIAPEHIEHIFDKFHRGGDELTTTIEGTGLGLSISRQIVEHYGGRIWATSAPGEGSTFTFTIPCIGPVSTP